ncbi:hypothetical protein MNV49_007877 [Pseudohyphozyma bogoriensis]|nr:hypothetical protein MNV49_007877 [Pseudohyphozyma bogoriensis]
MSEYWVSRDKYFCKYCKIYIADDKPSRQHHEQGLRHKGNYERFINGIYKRGEKEAKDKAEEERELARMEAAAHAAMAADGTPVASTSTLPPPAKKPKVAAAKPTDKFANYTTASDLGFEDPEADKLNAEREARANEGVIGGWEKVVKHKVDPKAVEAERERLEAERQEQEQREKEKKERKYGKYFAERTAGAGDDEYDPTKVVINVKRKQLTLKEEEELREEEERKAKVKEEAEKAERKRERLLAKSGWNEIEVKDEPMLEFEAAPQPEPKQEDDVDAKAGAGELVAPKVEDEDVKPAVEDVKPVVSGGFKKRKMHGANAARKRGADAS